jgi:hypothetical protein
VLQNLFTQNIIAVIWDFDKTLSPEYMERPSFDRFGYLTRHILVLQQSRNRGARAMPVLVRLVASRLMGGQYSPAFLYRRGSSKLTRWQRSTIHFWSAEPATRYTFPLV